MNGQHQSNTPPRLRNDLEFQPIEYQGRRALLVSDRLGLIKNPVMLQGEALEVLALIDGRREIRDIQLEFLRNRGYSLEGTSLVNEILQTFHQLGLLDTPEIRSRKQKMIEDYLALTVREPALAGGAYPADPEELKQFLDQILEMEKLPPEVEKALSEEKPLVLISPHIDFQRGCGLYSRAYRCLAGRKYRRVILLGTGHAVENGIISLTSKNFLTPLGPVRTENDLVESLRRAARGLISPDDFAHRNEHSIEFQLLFLQHTLGPDFTLVPILAGLFDPWLRTAGRASEIPGLKEFLKILAGAACQPDTLTVAGVDLCHIGLKFGHQQPASELRGAAAEFDRKLIETLLRWEPENFWKLFQNGGDRFNVCGFSSLALLLEIAKVKRGIFLGYEMVDEPATRSAVSFASLVFF